MPPREEYRRFRRRFREEYIYEMLRLSRGGSRPSAPLDHIAGVHHVAMRVARSFHASGGLIDLGLISGAALGHDLANLAASPGSGCPISTTITRTSGSPGGACRSSAISPPTTPCGTWRSRTCPLNPWRWWYADFRVKQTYDESRRETARLFTLQEAFDVILSKLDDVDDAKRLRYRYVYAKLRDFEDYLVSFGVGHHPPHSGRPTPAGEKRRAPWPPARSWPACGAPRWTTTSA